MLESLFFGFSFSSAHLAVQCAHVNYFFAFLESISINSWLHILFVSSLFSFQGTHCVGAISRRLYVAIHSCVSLSQFWLFQRRRSIGANCLRRQPVVGSSGLEPPTSRLSGVRSNQLSYEPILSFFGFLHLSFGDFSPWWR